MEIRGVAVAYFSTEAHQEQTETHTHTVSMHRAQAERPYGIWHKKEMLTDLWVKGARLIVHQVIFDSCSNTAG